MRFIILLILTFYISFDIYAQNVGQTGDSILNYTDINGMKQGRWITKYKNGKTKYDGYFVNNNPVGKFTRYLETGNLQSIAYFYDNSKSSSIKFYDAANNVIATGRYHNQKKDSIWNYFIQPEGKLMSVEEYNNGVLNGTSKTFYYPAGTLHEIINFKDGLRDGIYQKFWSDGKTPKLKMRYCAGIVCDTMFVYYESGKIQWVTPYKDDKRHGIEIQYNEKGERITVIPYKDGICLDPERAKQETREINKLQENKGRFLEPYQFDDPLDFLRKNQERDQTRY